MFEPGELSRRLWHPAGLLALALALSAAIALAPAPWTAVARDSLTLVLRPGHACAHAARRQSARLAAEIRCHWQSAEHAATLQRELSLLRHENRRLRAELAASAASPAPKEADDANDDRLLVAQCVAANVLGAQARAFLDQQKLLDVGLNAGIQSQALVLDARPSLIDRGADAQLKTDHFVLQGSRVWGKVADVGRFASTVHTVTDAGYRDLVRLGSTAPQRPAPQGILEGTGEPLARIRLVHSTEPVAPGDAVYAAAGQGVLPQPLLYGEVVRAEHAPGAPYWEIWMKPAVAPRQPERVAVLRTTLNALRVADRVPPAK